MEGEEERERERIMQTLCDYIRHTSWDYIRHIYPKFYGIVVAPYEATTQLVEMLKV